MFHRRTFQNLLSGFAGALLAVSVVGVAPVFGQAPADFRFIDTGALRDFTLAQDEVFVQRSVATDMKAEIEGRVLGATVIDRTDTHALVKVSDRINRAQLKGRTDALSTALPDARTFPVLYQAGLAQGKATRRVVTAKILAALPQGKTPAEIGIIVSAASARAASVPDFAIIEMPSAWHALDALPLLERAGIAANPMLGHAADALAAVPKDEFFSRQWHLHDTIRADGGLNAFPIDANVLGAWDVTLGAGVTISIVDSCLETGHPDLVANTPSVNTQLHFDFLDEDSDPNPHFGDNHGTSVAGVAAAKQNNGAPNPQTGLLLGVSGAAPNARLLGLRLINESGFVPVTDDEEASALNWKPSGQPIVDVSNNSWGPRTAAVGLFGPDLLTQAALRDAVQLGRDRKGQITLFAAGNGQQRGSEANLNGYANSRFVIAVGAIANVGQQSAYSESGANVLISAPSNGGTLGIVTTDDTGVFGYNPPFAAVVNLPNTDYTNDFGGTSSATPLVAGVTALLLSANPELGWRDVKEILASTARQVDAADQDWFDRVHPLAPAPVVAGKNNVGWVVNGGGFKFNHKYGGGMVDASAAVVRALDWTNLAQEQTHELRVPSTQLPLVIPDGSLVGLTIPFSFTGPNFPNLRVEHVEVTLDIEHVTRSHLDIRLVSPDGTESVLVAGGVPLGDNRDFKYAVSTGTSIVKQAQGWTFSSVHHWGENSTGTWRVVARDSVSFNVGRVLAATVRIHGTPSSAQRFSFERQVYSGALDNAIEPDNAIGAAPREVKINVQRLGPPTGVVSVDFTTSVRGTATADGPNATNPDYSPVGGTIIFGDGETTKEISIPILHDDLSEVNETIYLLLKNPSGGTLGGVNLATIEIIDNDANRVTVLATDPTATEPEEAVPADHGSFTISRTVPLATPLVVRFSIAGTATPGMGLGDDYTPVDFEVTIPANETSTTVTIVPRDDAAIEGVETVDLTLIPDPSYELGIPNTAQVRIIDNDRPRVQVSVVSAVRLLIEDDPARIATIRLSRTDDTSLPLQLDLDWNRGNQINGQNFQNADSGAALPTTVVIAAGQSTLDLNVRPVDDAVYQSTKQIVVAVQPNVNFEFAFGFLSTASLSILEDDDLPDAKIPKVTVASPRKNARVVFPAGVTASGSASDNGQVTRVEYRINGSPWKVVPGVVAGTAVNWMTPLALPNDPAPELQFGPNVFEVRSVDDDGNRSKVLAVTFNYVKEQVLTTNVAGPGTVTTGFAGQSTREAGVTYSVTAKPAAGQVFKGWTGLVNSPSRTIAFQMPAVDATLNAEFVASPFVAAIAGKYSGLAREVAFTFQTSAYAQLTLGSTGAFSGKLFLAGVTYPLKGEFSGEGLFVGQLRRKNDLPLEVNLTLDLNPAGTQRITGTITSPTFALDVQLDRAAFGPAAPAPGAVVQSYTMVLPPNDPLTNPQFQPHGNGIATVTIDAKGNVKAKGTLGDGTKFSLSQPLGRDPGTQNVTWPFFLQPYKKKGVVIGVIEHDATQTDSDFNGQVDWFKPSRPEDKYFPLGFTVEDNDVLGSIYTTTAGRALGGFLDQANNARITLRDGNIVNPIIKLATYEATNVVTISQPAGDELSLKVNAKAGTMAGSFIHPVSGKKTSIQGVLFQKQEAGIGFFPGTSIPGVPQQTGRVLLEPAP